MKPRLTHLITLLSAISFATHAHEVSDSQCATNNPRSDAIYETKITVTGLDRERTLNPVIRVNQCSTGKIGLLHPDGTPNVQISVRVSPAGAELPAQMIGKIKRPMLVEMQLERYVDQQWVIVAQPAVIAGLNADATVQVSNTAKDSISATAWVRRVN